MLVTILLTLFPARPDRAHHLSLREPRLQARCHQARHPLQGAPREALFVIHHRGPTAAEPRLTTSSSDADLAGKPFFPGLIEYMLSGPICAMVWEGRDAVKTGRGK